MTLITVTTIGYGEIRPGWIMPGGSSIRFLILGGNAMILLAFGVMTQTVIELELNQFFGKAADKKYDRQTGRPHHHLRFRKGGAGRGGRIARRSDIPFVVIDNNEERVEEAMKEGLLAVCADASRDETLSDVGIAKAQGSDRDTGVGRRQPVRDLLSAKGLNSMIAVERRAIAEESSEAKDAARGRELCVCPVQLHRPPHGAGDRASARGAVSGFHQPSDGHECRD